jgi:hypothetical protein
VDVVTLITDALVELAVETEEEDHTLENSALDTNLGFDLDVSDVADAEGVGASDRFGEAEATQIDPDSVAQVGLGGVGDVARVHSILRDLHVMRAPEGMQRDVAERMLIRPRESRADVAILLGEVADFLHTRRKDSEIVSLRRIHRPVRVIGVGCAAAEGAKVGASHLAAVSGQTGLKLTVFGASLQGAVSHSVKDKLQIECDSGQAKVGFVLIPLDEEIRKYTPPGGRESFPIRCLVPVKSVTSLTGGASLVSTEELLEAGPVRRSPIGGGDADFSGSVETQKSLDYAVELGGKFADDLIGLTVTAKLNGSITMSVTWSLPAGHFEALWTERPPGAYIDHN